jgi:membrane-associated protein
METVLALVRDYGTAVYVLLFAYCALKSGSLPLFAGYAAQTGAGTGKPAG